MRTVMREENLTLPELVAAGVLIAAAFFVLLWCVL